MNRLKFLLMIFVFGLNNAMFKPIEYTRNRVAGCLNDAPIQTGIGMGCILFAGPYTYWLMHKGIISEKTACIFWSAPAFASNALFSPEENCLFVAEPHMSAVMAANLGSNYVLDRWYNGLG